MRRDTRFWAICLAVFVLGAGLRVGAGATGLPWSPARARGQPEVTAANRELPAEAAQQVLEFYRAVDKGRYADAYALALENHWQKGETLQVDRLVQEDEFVSALENELGANGMALNIIAIQAVTQTLVSRQELDAARYPELKALDVLPGRTEAVQLGRVQLAGTLLGRCSRWDWTRDILVAELPDLGWRLLLPGVRKAHGLHSPDWFLPHE